MENIHATVVNAVSAAVVEWCAPGGPGGFNSQTRPSEDDEVRLVSAIMARLGPAIAVVEGVLAVAQDQRNVLAAQQSRVR
ncbi:hypothetical protein [Mycobacterium avium]|uniref:hypothetical protein n=1 Tax=Mycobacterium avium TaxID=1764 RepID=UPI0012DA6C3C|nr:hypothetical protein [Mycobacterium avium]